MPIYGGLVEIIPGTGQIIHQNLWATIQDELYANTDELGIALQILIRDKTPVDTGALWNDITYTAYHDQSSPDLVWETTADQEQLVSWKRIYAMYQEGLPLGHHTYTNPPRQMFLLTAEGDGLQITATWAQAHIQLALGFCVVGSGVPWP